MRQETNNTFDQGLNKDLNPIVTPSNVLTDCLNGTFITFNGDELSLQNDAGNTKITVPWDKRMLLEYTEGASYNSGVVVEIDKIMYRSLIDANTKPIFNEDNSLNEVYWELFDPSVKLSDGFYPIGIREYGGVLYIVSANKETNKVEFGSYPAPILSKGALKEDKTVIIDSEEVGEGQNLLYDAEILNNTNFKTGGYAIFDGEGSTGMDNLQIPADEKGLGGRPGFYKANLLHQLNNGSFDLTNDVWKKFREHKVKTGNTKTHWIDSVDGDIVFKYLSPNQYKGKLVVVIDIDEPEFFEFSVLPTAELTGENYRLTLDKLKWKNSDTIQITGFDWKLIFADGSIRTPANGGENPFIIGAEHNLVSYEVTPKTNYTWLDFPEEFRNKFTLKGTVLLAEKYYSIYFERSEGVCVLGKAQKRYELLILSNNGGKLGADLENIKEGEKPIAFLLEGHSVYKPEDRYIILGTYTIVNGKAVIKTINTEHSDFILQQPEGTQMLEVIKGKVGESEVLLEDSSCGEFDIYIKFNIGFTLKDPNSVEGLKFFKEEGRERIPIPYTVEDDRTFRISVNTMHNVFVWFENSDSSSTSIKIDRDDFENGKTFKIAKTVGLKSLYYKVLAPGGNMLPTTMIMSTESISAVNKNLLLGLVSTVTAYSDDMGQNNKKVTVTNFRVRHVEGDGVFLDATVTNPPDYSTAFIYFGGGKKVGLNEYYNINSDFFYKYTVDGLGEYIVKDPSGLYTYFDYSNINDNF